MTQGEKLYDALMRLPIVAFNLYFLVRETLGVRALAVAHPWFGNDWPFVSTVAARVSLVIFLAIAMTLHALRRRPISKYTAWGPKVTALAGTLLPYVVLLSQRSGPDLLWDGVSTAMMFVGSTLSILAVLDLGRSISIMPEARALVTGGLYAKIRHPLYFAEEIAALGFCLQFRNWMVLPVIIIHFYFQIRRMDWEEDVLLRAFPEYGDYKRGSYRLVPGLY